MATHLKLGRWKCLARMDTSRHILMIDSTPKSGVIKFIAVGGYVHSTTLVIIGM